jgi:hypothetical protein
LLAASKRPPHNIAAPKMTPLIHTSPGPAQTPHAPPQPAAADTTQPEPKSGSHYGTEFDLVANVLHYSPPSHANIFVIGTAVINTHSGM